MQGVSQNWEGDYNYYNAHFSVIKSNYIKITSLNDYNPLPNFATWMVCWFRMTRGFFRSRESVRRFTKC